MTCLCINQQQLLANLDLAFALGLKNGDREVQQFVILERQRHARVLKKSASIAACPSREKVSAVARTTTPSIVENQDLPRLTRSQINVVKQIVKGKAIKEIAFDMGRSHKTIEYHWNLARNRLGLRSIALVTQWALKYKLVKFSI